MADISKTGSFVAARNNFNADDIQKLVGELKDAINKSNISLNAKDTGYYVLTEFLNGQLFFPDPTLNSTTDKAKAHRQVYRKVINFGALPNTAAKSVAHGLTPLTSWTYTRMHGAATDTAGKNAIGIPYAGDTVSASGTLDLSVIKWEDTSATISSTVTSNHVSLRLDATNVIITTGSDRSAYTFCYVVLEYIKE